jgi:hypothetical protein
MDEEVFWGKQVGYLVATAHRAHKGKRGRGLNDWLPHKELNIWSIQALPRAEDTSQIAYTWFCSGMENGR